jgi:hypothetical protein
VKGCGLNSSMRRLCVRALLGLLALASGAAFAEPEAVISESQIKAAFLYNFTKFVEWPRESFTDKSEPITIGVLGNDALALELQSIVEGRRINGRAIVVHNVRGPDEVAELQMLFVSAAEDAQLAALQASAANLALLTVGESPAFAQAGGAITFLQQSGKLRFEINMRSVERAQLKISAELQKLALAVRREP